MWVGNMRCSSYRIEHTLAEGAEKKRDGPRCVLGTVVTGRARNLGHFNRSSRENLLTCDLAARLGSDVLLFFVGEKLENSKLTCQAFLR